MLFFDNRPFPALQNGVRSVDATLALERTA